MKFIKFGGSECGPTMIYPAHKISHIMLCEQLSEDGEDDACKILLFLNDEDRGIAECFYYDDATYRNIARNLARSRFEELLALLNA